MQRHARITQEAAFATYNASGATAFPRLGSPGSFRLDPVVNRSNRMDGLGLGVQQASKVTTTVLRGRFATDVGYTNAPFLMGWAGTRINPGQTSPWTTSMLPNDLASCTIDFAHEIANTATLRRKRNLGVVVESSSWSCASADQPDLSAAFDVVGSRQDGTDPSAVAFPVPACSVFPDDVYQLFDLAGNFSILGTGRTNFNNWSLAIQNRLSLRFNESRTATMIRCTGRTVAASCELLHKSTPDDWAAYEQGTQGACSFTFTQAGHTMAIDLKGKCYINGIDRDPTADGESYYSLAVVNQLDSASCKDFEVTFS